MTAQVLPFRPREQKSELPSDVEQDTCSCWKCLEPEVGAALERLDRRKGEDVKEWAAKLGAMFATYTD